METKRTFVNRCCTVYRQDSSFSLSNAAHLEPDLFAVKDTMSTS